MGFMETLENDLAKLRGQGVDARVASGGGRMYVTMDRYENDWDVVKEVGMHKFLVRLHTISRIPLRQLRS